MAQTTESALGIWTAVDLASHFGPIPLNRIRFDPPPGKATEADLLAICEREERLYELVDGVLVERHATLDGGDVLPGFQFPLEQLFAPPTRPPE